MDKKIKFRKSVKVNIFQNKWTVFTAIAAIALLVLSVWLHPLSPAPEGIDIHIVPQVDKPERTITVFDHKLGQTVQMDMEDYVFHALSGEMFASYQPEALKAQACAIRTYVEYKIQHGGCGKYEGADVCTDYTSCLAFSRDDEMEKKWGEKYDEYAEKMREAAADTQGEIITYEGEPINALFFSNAAGRTDDVQNVFGGNLAYLKGVESYETPDSFKYEEVEEFTKDEFLEKISAAYPEITEGNIEILSRDDSGRVQTVRIGGSELKGTEVRTALALNSTNFTVEVSGNSVVFDVKGYGHGVGLSQAGAEEMAKRGYDYKAILKHYYTDVEIE